MKTIFYVYTVIKINVKKCYYPKYWEGEKLNENMAVILSASITAFVTILGFVVTYFLNKRNFREEVIKQKVNIHLDKIAELPYKIQELIDLIVENKNDELFSKFKELMTTILAYGSKDAIILVTNMQELSFTMSEKPNILDYDKVIVCYILLLCQVKYDLTGIEINPEFWYRMRRKDYPTIKQSIIDTCNEIVISLELSEFLKIK